MIKEFKEFALHSNMVDVAIGFILGAAFGKIVTSLVNDIFMPPIGMLLGQVDFSNLFFALSTVHYKTLTQARSAGAVTINYGLFLNTVIDFFIVSFVMFLLVRQINRIKRRRAVSELKSKECPYCISQIPLNATRCAHCTSVLDKPVTGEK
jgi:large conductance mechanosensitive channel